MAAPSGVSLISVALVDDNRLLRDGLASLLSRARDISCVAGVGTDEVDRLRHAVADIVLLALGGDRARTALVAAGISRDFPETRLVVLDLAPDEPRVSDLVAAGVAGFVLRHATLEDLLRTIRAVAAGSSVLPVPMVAGLFLDLRTRESHAHRASTLDVRLTPRERQVIALIADGLSNKEIAVRLHVATHTVKSHVRNAMEKLALHTRLQISAYVHGDRER